MKAPAVRTGGFGHPVVVVGRRSNAAKKPAVFQAGYAETDINAPNPIGGRTSESGQGGFNQTGPEPVGGGEE